MRNYKYFLSLVPGAVVVFGNLQGGWWGMSNLIFSLGVLALIEWFFPEDKSNDHESTRFIPDSILVLNVLMQTCALTSLFLAIHEHKFSSGQLLLACISNGINTGTSAVVVAHEMIHRKERHWQIMGKYLLFTAGNIYFYVEHLRVHHRHVGTDADPASARLNESLYGFFRRTTAEQISGSWKMELERIHKEKQSLSHHYGFVSLLSLILLLILVAYILGVVGVIAFLIQALIANFLLEYTNYIEHYGLTRNPGERVTEIHSWQSDKVISRFFLTDLSRHSDHHYYASKPYHVLDSYEKSPVLPGGYASAIYLALIPPLWFKVMNHRISRERANERARNGESASG
jgi:alkane 1-monooxygenase